MEFQQVKRRTLWNQCREVASKLHARLVPSLL